MSYSSRAFEDQCKFLGLELGSERSFDLVMQYNEDDEPIPAWLLATWTVRLCACGGVWGTTFHKEWKRGEHPVDPADVATASRAFCMWPALGSDVEESLYRDEYDCDGYEPRWFDDPTLVANIATERAERCF